MFDVIPSMKIYHRRNHSILLFVYQDEVETLPHSSNQVNTFDKISSQATQYQRKYLGK